MRNKEYWAARALQRENEAYLRGAGLSAKMFQEYETAAKAIRREIDGFYSKYAGKYGLNIRSGRPPSEPEGFQGMGRQGLDAYVAQIAQTTDAHARALLTAQLDALSANSSISRLEALQGQIDLILNDLFDKGVAQMKEEFGDMFVEGYYKKCYDIQSRAGFFNEIAKIDFSTIEPGRFLPLVRRHVFRSPVAKQTGPCLQYQGNNHPGTDSGKECRNHVFRPIRKNGPVLQER